MNDNIIFALLKFGKENNIYDMYNNGTIFMNTIEYFRKTEDNNLRGDKYEGVSKIKNTGKSKVIMIGADDVNKGKKIELDVLNIHIKEGYSQIAGNIYSLYSISLSKIKDNPSIWTIDNKINDFGTHCLLIKGKEDIEIFLSKIGEELSKQNVSYETDIVSYYDTKLVNKDITLFEKPMEFEWQKEFRIYAKRNSIEPLKLNIGNMEKYSQILLTKDMLNEKIEFKINEQK